MAAKKKAEPQAQEISVELNMKTISIPIKSVSPLIVSRFDEKSRKQIQEIGEAEAGLKQGGKKKNIVDPQEQYENSIYFMKDGKSCGMPAGAFKAAMVRAASVVYGRVMTTTKMMFRVLADEAESNLVKINGQHRMREDMVRVGPQKVAAPRYRAEFPEWNAVIRVQYIANVISEKEIVAFLNAAGFCCGVGEWRPEKAASGSFGTFTVANS